MKSDKSDLQNPHSSLSPEKLVKAVGEDIVKVVFDSDKPNDVG